MLTELAKDNCPLGVGDQKSGLQKSANPINLTDTRKELAKEAGVSHDTILLLRRFGSSVWAGA